MNNCWHQRQLRELAAARERVAALDRQRFMQMRIRLDLCRERLTASDKAWRQGRYAEAIKFLKEELSDGLDSQ